MDGARFANAVVATGASPADLTWRRGVDVLSFGATKGGALAAEAIVSFDHSLDEVIQRHRKRFGHLLSKQRSPPPRSSDGSAMGCGCAMPPTPTASRPASVPVSMPPAWPCPDRSRRTWPSCG